MNKPILIFPDTNIEVGGSRLKNKSSYIPAPSSYKVKMSDIDLNDQRSLSGYLTRDRVRQNTYSISCSWDRLTEHQLYRLLSACQEAKFKLTFRDPLNTSNYYTTKNEMYADANKEANLVASIDDEDDDVPVEDFWTLSLTFVEY